MKRLLLLLTLPFTLHAQMLGSFQGEGEALTLNWESDCPRIEAHLQKTSPDELILTGGFECTEVSRTWPKRTFKIKGENLFWQGEEIGEYREDLFRVIFEDGAHRIILKKRDSGDYFFRQMWSNRVRFLLIEGQLQSL